MASKTNSQRMRELLLEALETERGGIQVYETALGCVQNADLREEFEKYLEQTRNHEQVVMRLLEEHGIDPEEEVPGREVVRTIGNGLVEAMTLAKSGGTPDAAEIVAVECVVLAETKDHANWELIGELVKQGRAQKSQQALADAHAEVEEEEDKHLYHSHGWARELWLQSLGLPAVLPPPEEEKDVTTAIGAARAKEQSAKMI